MVAVWLVPSHIVRALLTRSRLAILSQGDWIPLCFRVNRRAVAVYDVLPEVQTLGL